jgi:integrase
LATLLDRLEVTELPESQRRALRSTVISAARLLGADPGQLAAELPTLLARLDRIHPVQAKVTRKRLQNLRAELRRAFEAVGWRVRHNKGRFTPAWRALFEALPTKFQRGALTRFFRFCSERGIAPDQVDDAVAPEFRHYLDHIDFCRDPTTRHRDVCRVWNQMAERIAGWPQVRLTVPRSDRFWGLSWDAFLPTLLADVEAFLAQDAAEDPFDDRAPLKPLRPATIQNRLQKIRLFASALVLSGHPADSLRSVADLFAPGAFKKGMRVLLDRAEKGAKTQPGAVGVCLLAIAKYWVRLPKSELDPMRRVITRIRERPKGMAEKNKEILRQFDDPIRLRALLEFPFRVLEDVSRAKEVTRAAARQVETAVAVEVLIKTAIRRGNLASIHLDQHLRWIRTRNGVSAHLVFPEHEVKNGKNLAFELSGETARLLQIYLDVYRPKLVNGANRFLFPGRESSHKVDHRLSSQITKDVHARTGLFVTPHIFRHLMAKLILADNLANQEGARQSLGHRSVKTTIEFYCEEQRAVHLRHYDDLIERQRDIRACGLRSTVADRIGPAGRRGDRP